MKKFIGIILFFVFLIYQSAYSQILPTFVQEKKATMLSGNKFLTGVTLSNDEQNIFVRYNENFASLLQYTLTKPFDVSSKDTTSEVSFNLYAGSDDLDNNSIQDLTFNNDGTKLFVIDEVGGMNIHTLSMHLIYQEQLHKMLMMVLTGEQNLHHLMAILDLMVFVLAMMVKKCFCLKLL